MDTGPRRPEIDHLLRQCQELKAAAIRTMCESADPVRAELGRELASGRITTQDLAVSSAYRDLLEEGLAAYLTDPPPERQADTSARPSQDPADVDEDDFSQRTVLQQVRPPQPVPTRVTRRYRRNTAG